VEDAHGPRRGESQPVHARTYDIFWSTCVYSMRFNYQNFHRGSSRDTCRL